MDGELDRFLLQLVEELGVDNWGLVSKEFLGIAAEIGGDEEMREAAKSQFAPDQLEQRWLELTSSEEENAKKHSISCRAENAPGLETAGQEEKTGEHRSETNLQSDREKDFLASVSQAAVTGGGEMNAHFPSFATALLAYGINPNLSSCRGGGINRNAFNSLVTHDIEGEAVTDKQNRPAVFDAVLEKLETDYDYSQSMTKGSVDNVEFTRLLGGKATSTVRVIGGDNAKKPGIESDSEDSDGCMRNARARMKAAAVQKVKEKCPDKEIQAASFKPPPRSSFMVKKSQEPLLRSNRVHGEGAGAISITGKLSAAEELLLAGGFGQAYVDDYDHYKDLSEESKKFVDAVEAKLGKKKLPSATEIQNVVAAEREAERELLAGGGGGPKILESPPSSGGVIIEEVLDDEVTSENARESEENIDDVHENTARQHRQRRKSGTSTTTTTPDIIDNPASPTPPPSQPHQAVVNKGAILQREMEANRLRESGIPVESNPVSGVHPTQAQLLANLQTMKNKKAGLSVE
eukprot:g17533.t1